MRKNSTTSEILNFYKPRTKNVGVDFSKSDRNLQYIRIPQEKQFIDLASGLINYNKPPTKNKKIPLKEKIMDKIQGYINNEKELKKRMKNWK